MTKNNNDVVNLNPSLESPRSRYLSQDRGNSNNGFGVKSFFKLINQEHISEDGYREIEGLLAGNKSLIQEIYHDDEKENRPLHIACQKCDLKLATMILEQCDEKERAVIANQTNQSSMTPLYYVCLQKGFDPQSKLQLAKLLLENKADPEFVNINNQYTPKDVAAKRNPAIKELIDETQEAEKNAKLLANEQKQEEERQKQLAEKEKQMELKEKKAAEEKIAAEKLEQERQQKEQAQKIVQSRIIDEFRAMQQDNPELKVEIDFNKNGNFKINAKDEHGNNFTHHICGGLLKKKDGDIGKDLAMVKTLVTEGADLNRQNLNGNIPILIASKIGYNEMVTYLVQNYSDQIDYSLSNNAGDNVLHSACSFCSPEVVKLLLEKVPPTMINKCDKNGDTPLLRAGKSRNFPVMEMMLNLNDSRIKLNAIGGDGSSIMNYLAVANNPDLIDKVAQAVTAEDLAVMMTSGKLGCAPMHSSSSNPNPKITEKFLQYDQAFNTVNSVTNITKDSPLHVAAAFGNLATLQLLLEQNIDVNALNGLQRNALHSLAVNTPTDQESDPERVEMARVLLQKGCDLRTLDQEGKAPFDYVITKSGLGKEFNNFFQNIIKAENKEIDQRCNEIIFEPSLPRKVDELEFQDIISYLFNDEEDNRPETKEEVLGYLCLINHYKRNAEIPAVEEGTSWLLDEGEKELRDHLEVVKKFIAKYPDYASNQEIDWENLSKKEAKNLINKISVHLIENLIESGADVNKTVTIFDFDTTPFILACSQGNFLAAKVLSRHVEDFNHYSPSDLPALYYCSTHNNKYSNEIARDIIARGNSNLDWRDDRDDSVIQLACQFGNYDLVKDLIAGGASFKMADVADILKEQIPDANERKKIALEFLKTHSNATSTTNLASSASASQVVAKSEKQLI